MRRTATIILHWLSFLLLLLLIAGGPIPVLAWGFGIAGLAQCAMALVGGLILEGALRIAHPWMSWAMYLALGLVSTATLAAQLGYVPPGPTLPEMYFYLMSASALHGIFHLWRHTALGDGALRRIKPASMHGML